MCVGACVWVCVPSLRGIGGVEFWVVLGGAVDTGGFEVCELKMEGGVRVWACVGVFCKVCGGGGRWGRWVWECGSAVWTCVILSGEVNCAWGG